MSVGENLPVIENPNFEDQEVRGENILSQDQSYWSDDFIGDSVDALWGSPVNGAIIADGVNGQIEFDTTAGDATAGISMASFDNWDPQYACGIEFRYKIETRADTSHFLGFFNGTNKIRFVIDNGDNNIDLEADGGTGSAVDTDTGIDVDSNWHIYKIQTVTDGSVKAYIDNVLVLTTAANTVAIDGTQASYVRFFIDDLDATQGVSQLDYVRIWQNRS